VKTANKEGTFWIAAPNRIYSYSVSDPLADNTGAIEKIRVFEFDNKREYLKTLYQADEGSWRRDQIFLGRNSKRYSLSQEVITEEALPPDSLAFSESEEPFGQAINKPTHLNTPETVLAIRTTESELEKRSLEVSLQRRYSAPLLPLVIAFFTAPFALRFGRGGRVATVAYAIGVWLLFTGTNTLFEQYGLSGTLSQFNAVWSPLLLFTLIGSYLLTRIRT
jgi:lipopolysaccharide export LptBFGC system permease protein LptF